MAFGRQWSTVLPGGPLNLPLCCSRPFAGSAAAAAALKLSSNVEDMAQTMHNYTSGSLFWLLFMLHVP